MSVRDRPLYNYISPTPTPTGCSLCDETVTFEGKCVRASELNFIMYGWGTQVCNFPENVAIMELWVGLSARGGDIWERIRKTTFAQYGADFSHGLPSVVVWPHRCAPQRDKLNVDIHDWQWMGLKWLGW